MTELNEQQPLPLDRGSFEVEINVSTSPEREKIVAARLRRPTLEEEVEREQRSATEIRPSGKDGEEYHSDAEAADADLFDRVAVAVKGFRLAGEPKEAASEWREPSPELKSLIPSNWKALFVRGVRSGEAEISPGLEDDEDVVLGASETISVDYFFPSKEDAQFKVVFEVPTPTERERQKFTDEVLRVIYGTRGKKSSKIVTNLKASVAFFDSLMRRPSARVVGATVQGQSFEQMSASPLSLAVFLGGIDPLTKAKVVAAALSKFNARLRD